MTTNYKLVIFDFDGTLADSFGWFVDNVNTVADRYGFKKLIPTELEEVRHLSARQLLERVELPLWKLPLVTRSMRRQMAEHIHEIKLFAGANQLLRELAAAGVLIAIVTSNSKANVIQVLGPDNVSHIRYFGCGASIFGKQRKIRQVLRISGVSADQVLCVGDEIRDAEVAEAMGLTFAGVGWGFTHPDQLQRFSDLPILKQPGDLLPMVMSV